MMKKFAFVITLLAVIVLYGKNLNPFSNSMFTFHDETQPARIQQFTLNLRQFKIPPRIAPDFSFKLGYPVFDLYAPASYWITSGIHLLGVDIVNSLKLSFLLTIIVGFSSMLLFLSCYFAFIPSIVGAISYISILYYSVEIFVRGNLGEAWFLALLPLAFYTIEKLSRKYSRFYYAFTTLTLFLLFTVHNLLSFVGIALIIVYAIFRPRFKLTFTSIFIALLLSSYFLIPLIAENHLTYAKHIAEKTIYSQHFICASQLWQSNWGYGGSIGNCNDGFSFKIGKIQVVLFLAGLALFLFNLVFRKNRQKNFFMVGSFAALSLGSLFMTINISKPFWDLLSPVLSIFQFPWRFISFAMIGIGFVIAYLLDTVKFPLKNIIYVVIGIVLVITSSKYFMGQEISKQSFENRYLSQIYIKQEVAYKVPEYLPKTANYDSWRAYELQLPKHQPLGFDYHLPVQSSASAQVIVNHTFNKQVGIRQPGIVYLNIHYFPVWRISIDGKTIVPSKFDSLGRPILFITKPSRIIMRYVETPIEKLGNVMTIIGLIALVTVVIKRKKQLS